MNHLSAFNIHSPPPPQSSQIQHVALSNTHSPFPPRPSQIQHVALSNMHSPLPPRSSQIQHESLSNMQRGAYCLWLPQLEEFNAILEIHMHACPGDLQRVRRALECKIDKKQGICIYALDQYNAQTLVHGSSRKIDEVKIMGSGMEKTTLSVRFKLLKKNHPIQFHHFAAPRLLIGCGIGVKSTSSTQPLIPANNTQLNHKF